MKTIEEKIDFLNKIDYEFSESTKRIGEALMSIHKRIVEAEKKRLTKIMNKTKNRRIENKLKKRIDGVEVYWFSK